MIPAASSSRGHEQVNLIFVFIVILGFGWIVLRQKESMRFYEVTGLVRVSIPPPVWRNITANGVDDRCGHGAVQRALLILNFQEFKEKSQRLWQAELTGCIV